MMPPLVSSFCLADQPKISRLNKNCQAGTTQEANHQGAALKTVSHTVFLRSNNTVQNGIFKTLSHLKPCSGSLKQPLKSDKTNSSGLTDL
jgi:hypothetical protein